MPVSKRLIELELDAAGVYIPSQFHFNVHSANPVGRENIRAPFTQYLIVRLQVMFRDTGKLRGENARLSQSHASEDFYRMPYPTSTT